MGLLDHAKEELRLLSLTGTPDNRPIIEEFSDEILALCDKMANSGHSGGSAPYVIVAISSAVKKLMSFEPLTPLTGEDDEWTDISEYQNGEEGWQNRRLTSVFKGKGGAYYLNAIVWKEGGNTFGGRVEGITSRQFIKFPFTPKTFYIDVEREILPNDWSEEPFYEDTDAGGIIEKYRYKIKDKSQLDVVFKFYEKQISTI